METKIHFLHSAVGLCLPQQTSSRHPRREFVIFNVHEKLKLVGLSAGDRLMLMDFGPDGIISVNVRVVITVAMEIIRAFRPYGIIFMMYYKSVAL